MSHNSIFNMDEIILVEIFFLIIKITERVYIRKVHQPFKIHDLLTNKLVYPFCPFIAKILLHFPNKFF